ncbi:hypothetical protein [Qaidamihabitans albus]|uniref:hypothetical protein n=1 Tax=Qaidamihabitans albus TaxID=2795733 RepID=UPI0018F14051|nr:hypothetical protein [Qaidamihabitans albus]
MNGPEAARAFTGASWWEQEAAASPEPDVGSVVVDGSEVGRGSRVLLRPTGRTDAQDMFVAGKVATVRAIRQDVDGTWFLAVTVEGDPAADLMLEQERYRYFTTAEVTPLPEGDPA